MSLTSLTKAAELSNLSAFEFLEKNVSDLVIAEIPRHLKTFLVSREGIPKVVGLPPKPDTAPKKIDAEWMVLSRLDLENIFQFGHIQIHEFNCLALKNDKGEVVTISAAEIAEIHNQQPKTNKFRIPAMLYWKGSTLFLAEENGNENELSKIKKCSIVIQVKDLFVRAEGRSGPIIEPIKDLSIHGENTPPLRKPDWSSTNLHHVNRIAIKFHNSEPIDYNTLKKDVEKYIRENLKNNKGGPLGKNKFDPIIKIIMANIIIKTGINVDGLGGEVYKKLKKLAKALDDINCLAKITWDKTRANGKKFPSVKVLIIDFTEKYYFDDAPAQAAASLIMPDDRTR